MKAALEEIGKKYRAALDAYATAQDEASLQRAYEIGREAIAAGMGALDLVWVHLAAAGSRRDGDIENDVAGSSATSRFLMESLGAIEMTHRGFLETIETLSSRAAELELANRKLTAEIAAREAVQSELLRREGQLADAQKVAHVGSWEWDLAGDRVTWTDELYRIFSLVRGGPPLTYTTYLERVHPEDRHMIEQTLQNALRTHDSFEFDHRTVSAGGPLRWIHAIGKVIVGPDGTPVKLTGTAQDITERKRLEGLFQSLVENSSDIFTILNQDGTVRYESPAIERVLGYDGAGLVGKNAFEFVHPDDLRAVLDIFQKGVQTPGYTAAQVFRFRHRDGSWRTLEAIGKNLSDLPGLSGILVSSRDITEKMKLQAQLDRAAAQRESDAKTFAGHLQQAQEEERQRIARELHDDVCQRLTAMRLQINMIEDDDGIPRQARRTQVRSVKKQLDASIDELRRISDGLRPVGLDLFGLESTLRAMCHDMKEASGIRVNFAAEGIAGKRFDKTVEIALYRIAQEALSNAVRHSGTRVATLSLARENGTVTLAIQDRGRGFSPDRNGPRSDVRGTGHGLINMRERAEILGGTFQIVSKAEQGTSVSVTIPVQDHEQA